MSLGEKIKAVRQGTGMSVAQLARAVGVTEKAVSNWEANQRHPRFEHMVAIARATGEPLEHFAGEETDGETAADTSVHQ